MIRACLQVLDGAGVADGRGNFSACRGPIAQSPLILKRDAGVVFAAEEDGNRGDVEPDQGGDAGSERSVNERIVGKPGNVPAEEQGDNEPEHGGHRCSGHYPFPAVRVRGAEMVDNAQDAYTSDKGDRPAHGEPEDEHVAAEFVVGVLDHPELNLVAEDDEERGAAHGDEATGNEKDGQDPLIPEIPGLAVEFIGAQEAFHERQHDAHGGDGADEDGRDEDLDGPLMLVLQIRLGEVHGVVGEDFVQGRTNLAAKGVAAGSYGNDGGKNEECGENAQDGRICGCLGCPQNVMIERLDHCFPEVDEESQHTSEE
jgi:hypothetical protein